MIRAAIYALALLALSACGGGLEALQDPNSTLCKPGTAQINVGDGYLTAVCGCTEGAGVRVDAPAPLTCTIARGTVLFFSYLESALPHQILSTGAATFPSSPPSNRANRDEGIPVHAVPFDTAGSFGFQDAYFPGLSGTVVVTP